MKKLILTAVILSTMSLNASAKAPANELSFKEIVAETESKHATAKEMFNVVWKQRDMQKPFVEHFLYKANAAKKASDEDSAIDYALQALAVASGELRQAEAMKTNTPSWVK